MTSRAAQRPSDDNAAMSSINWQKVLALVGIGIMFGALLGIVPKVSDGWR